MLRCMRTTLTLEPDVAAALERLRKDRELTLKAAVNEALRRGLRALEEPEPGPEPFRLRTWHGARARVENLDDVAEVLALAEGDAFR